MLKVITNRLVGLFLLFDVCTICLTSSTPWFLVSFKRSLSDMLGKIERSMVPLEVVNSWFVSRIVTGMLSTSVVLRRAKQESSSCMSIRSDVLCLCGIMDVTAGNLSFSLLAKMAGLGGIALASLLL